MWYISHKKKKRGKKEKKAGKDARKERKLVRFKNGKKKRSNFEIG